LGSFGGGKTPSTTQSNYWDGDILWVTPKDMKSLSIINSIDKVTENATQDGLALFPERSILIVVRSGILRRMVPVAVNAIPCTVNQDLKVLTLAMPVMAEYVLLMVRGFEKFILENLTKIGTTVESIRFEDFERQQFPLPPFSEQTRIVAKVEELMALCDALESRGVLESKQHAQLTATLFDALAASESAHQLQENWTWLASSFDLILDRPEAVDALEQTLLQLAVRGLLVEQDPNDQPASELLKQIRAEKDRLIAEGKIKKDKPLPAITDEEKPFELPQGWEWVCMPQIAESRLGKMLDKAKNTGSAYPYLRNTNVQWNRFELDDIKEIFLEVHELGELRLRRGDLLICEGGEPGRCAIWCDEADEMYFQKALHRVRTIGGVLPEFIVHCLESDAFSGRLNEYFTGATIKHFSGQELNRYTMPLPPLAEQSRIVARVEALRTLCAELRARLTASQKTQTHLAETLVEGCV
jgi:type I restriction enzyme S subunit